ncbi:hypothetical protein M9H77_16703 [Catharanthus roseus]|uniref:Uncharacterized protein n=1 Tax=Catharanthus roseus TaxID=4058 RepID=A0ACC0B2H0_CATRO|nr:hypothetical protein M9H77_16703 [Catharanthus roseus]
MVWGSLVPILICISGCALLMLNNLNSSLGWKVFVTSRSRLCSRVELSASCFEAMKHSQPTSLLPMIVWSVLLICTSIVAEYAETLAFSAFSARHSRIPLYEEGASTIRKSSYRSLADSISISFHNSMRCSVSWLWYRWKSQYFVLLRLLCGKVILAGAFMIPIDSTSCRISVHDFFMSPDYTGINYTFKYNISRSCLRYFLKRCDNDKNDAKRFKEQTEKEDEDPPTMVCPGLSSTHQIYIKTYKYVFEPVTKCLLLLNDITQHVFVDGLQKVLHVPQKMHNSCGPYRCSPFKSNYYCGEKEFGDTLPDCIVRGYSPRTKDDVDGLLTLRVDPLEEGRSTWRAWPNRYLRGHPIMLCGGTNGLGTARRGLKLRVGSITGGFGASRFSTRVELLDFRQAVLDGTPSHRWIYQSGTLVGETSRSSTSSYALRKIIPRREQILVIDLSNSESVEGPVAPGIELRASIE